MWAHIRTGAYTHRPHACVCTGHIHTCTPCTAAPRERMRVGPKHVCARAFARVACGCPGCAYGPGQCSRLVFRAVLPAFCPRILPRPCVSPGYRPLTLLGEFCLCSRRQQGCAATGTPLLRGRPQTGALPTCPCTRVTPSWHELLPPSWLWPTNIGGLPEGGSTPLLPLFRGCGVSVLDITVILTSLLLPYRLQPQAETGGRGWYANSMQRIRKSSHYNLPASHGLFLSNPLCSGASQLSP